MSEFGFTLEDTHELAALALERDSRGIAQWCEDHVRTYADMHALHEWMGRVIYTTWPMGLAADATRENGDVWILQVGDGASPAAIASGQLLSTSLNGDWETLTALINAMIEEHPDEHHAAVTAYVVAAVGDGLRAIGGGE